ncbi:unnamed protein product, partial [Polarella glacialis]
VQQLQQHLDGLQVDDVQELITVLRCLQDGVEEGSLVIKSLRLLRAFLERHLSLHDRASQQGLVPALVAAMRAHPHLDVMVSGVAVLSALLEGAGRRGLLGSDVASINVALGPGGGEDLPVLSAATGEDLVTLVAKSGGIDVLTDGLHRYPACEQLQERGCCCLGLLAKGGQQPNRVSAGYQRGKHAESAVMLRSQARRLISRHGGL